MLSDQHRSTKFSSLNGKDHLEASTEFAIAIVCQIAGQAIDFRISGEKLDLPGVDKCLQFAKQQSLRPNAQINAVNGRAKNVHELTQSRRITFA